MKKILLLSLLLAFFMNSAAMAFATNDERIDNFLQTLASNDFEKKEQMLNRLQWSGLTEPRLYDEIERQLEAEYKELNPGKEELNLASYKLRALGYSGNEKYRAFIIKMQESAANSKLKRHAKKALQDLDQFIVWNKLIADSTFVAEGKNAEVTSYMKMLGVNDYFVQRLAARAIFYEHQSDTDLLDLAAEKLEMLYLQKDLDTEWQDTASWLCKAIGQSGKAKYKALLSTVAENTPHRKIKKYAGKYI